MKTSKRLRMKLLKKARIEISAKKLEQAIEESHVDQVKNYLSQLFEAGAYQHIMTGPAQAFLRKMDSAKGESHVRSCQPG